jgi:outer membrane protein assembly factor BamD
MKISSLLKKSKLFIVLFLLLLASIGCATTDEKKTLGPQELLQKGVREIKNKDIVDAKSTFKLLLEDYPDSKERVPGLMHLADLHYNDDEYEESKFHYTRFIELYPAHKNVDRAHYYKSMSNFKTMGTASRDQTHTRMALAGFDTLVRNFPDSVYHNRAVKKKKFCIETLAKNVFEIGKYYYRTGSYHSAIIRLQSLRADYPDQPFEGEAIFILAESYYNEENFDEAKDSYIELLKKHPKSEFAKKAKNRLKTLRR